MPWAAAALSSPTRQKLLRNSAEIKRRLSGQPHTIDVFLKLDDPYSCLLVQVLPDLVKRFSLELKLNAVHQLDDEMFPQPQQWQTQALSDSLHIAKRYNLDMQPRLPPHKVSEFLGAFVRATKGPDALANTQHVFSQFWGEGDLSAENKAQTDTKTTLAANEKKLAQLGHYLSATIFYGGEWYWGLDRLYHLEHRLNALLPESEQSPEQFRLTEISIDTQSAQIPIADEQHQDRPQIDMPKLTVFFSARSPYSYLGLENAIRLSEFYDIELDIKPVLPMVMRGLAVPQRKKMYIFHDTKREATRHGIPYGKVADPLGAGVERCYALFNYAQQKGKEIAYLRAYARAVNAEGIRSETDEGMKQIVERCGLSWQHARQLLPQASFTSAPWRKWAEDNMNTLTKMGLWGVPCFQYRDTVVWGQDRLFIIEQAIVDARAKDI